jgi:hypothetical protein
MCRLEGWLKMDSVDYIKADKKKEEALERP